MIKSNRNMKGGKIEYNPNIKKPINGQINFKKNSDIYNKQKMKETEELYFENMDDTYNKIINDIVSHDNEELKSTIRKMDIKSNLIKKNGDSFQIGDLEYISHPNLKTNYYNR